MLLLSLLVEGVLRCTSFKSVATSETRFRSWWKWFQADRSKTEGRVVKVMIVTLNFPTPRARMPRYGAVSNYLKNGLGRWRPADWVRAVWAGPRGWNGPVARDGIARLAPYHAIVALQAVCSIFLKIQFIHLAPSWYRHFLLFPSLFIPFIPTPFPSIYKRRVASIAKQWSL